MPPVRGGAGWVSEGSESAVARVPEPRDDVPVFVQLGVNHCGVHVEPCGVASVTVPGMEKEKGGAGMGGDGLAGALFRGAHLEIFLLASSVQAARRRC